MSADKNPPMEKAIDQTAQLIKGKLIPGAGLSVYRYLDEQGVNNKAGRHVYRVLSLMRAAMRSRAVAHRRSTERAETPNASAVSDVVNPAK